MCTQAYSPDREHAPRIYRSLREKRRRTLEERNKNRRVGKGKITIGPPCRFYRNQRCKQWRVTLKGSCCQLTEFIAVSDHKYEQSADAQVGNQLTDGSQEETRLSDDQKRIKDRRQPPSIVEPQSHVPPCQGV